VRVRVRAGKEGGSLPGASWGRGPSSSGPLCRPPPRSWADSQGHTTHLKTPVITSHREPAIYECMIIRIIRRRSRPNLKPHAPPHTHTQVAEATKQATAMQASITRLQADKDALKKEAAAAQARAKAAEGQAVGVGVPRRAGGVGAGRQGACRKGAGPSLLPASLLWACRAAGAGPVPSSTYLAIPCPSPSPQQIQHNAQPATNCCTRPTCCGGGRHRLRSCCARVKERQSKCRHRVQALWPPPPRAAQGGRAAAEAGERGAGAHG